MAEGFVQVAVDGAGKQIDNDVVAIPAGTVITDGSGNQTVLAAPAYYFRQRTVNADANNPLAVASVASTPGANDFGLTVRMPVGQADLQTIAALLLDIDANIAALAGNPPLSAIGGQALQVSNYLTPAIGQLPPQQVTPTIPRTVIGDKFGRQIMLPQTVRELVTSFEATITTTTETPITAATGDQVTVCDIVAVIASNTSATAVRVDIRDQLSTVTSPPTLMGGVIPLYIPAGDTRGVSLGGVLIPQSNVGQQWTATLSAAVTDVRIWTLYAKNQR